MRQIILIFTLFTFSFILSQKKDLKNETKIADRYQSKQPQDFSVPPPPKMTFPAQFPDGNRTFLKKLIKILIKKT